MTGDNGSIFTCKHHPTLRWANTKPGGRLFFMGEILEDGSLKPDHPIAPTPPIEVLKARLGGYNQFNKDIPETPVTEWAQVIDYVEYVQSSMEKWAFECACPGADLIVLDDETYESVSARENRDA